MLELAKPLHLHTCGCMDNLQHCYHLQVTCTGETNTMVRQLLLVNSSMQQQQQLTGRDSCYLKQRW